MATSCLMTIPRSIFDSVGFNREKMKAEYHKRLFEERVEIRASQEEEEEESSEEDIDEIPDLVLLLVELEYLSLIFKLWLRRIHLTKDSVKHHKLQDFEHTVLTTEESVIKPYIKYLMLNRYKSIEELSSEAMVQFYCRRLEEQCAKISIEKEKANFEMAEEGRLSLNKNTVHVCSFLGLKLDFLDRLEDMPRNIRSHRNLCDWVVIFLRNNYEGHGFTDKDSLDKEMLDRIGFDPLSSAVETILARASNLPDMQQHIDGCEWAESFVEDEFKYNPLFSQQNERFPFKSNKTNEWFKLLKVELNSYDDNCPCQVNIMNLVSKEWKASLATTRSLLNEFEDEQHTLLFHGTDHESAIDILDGRGIHLSSGRQKRDFSSGKGFYLTKNVDDALNWASSKTAKPAILVFRVNNQEFLNGKSRKLTLNQPDIVNWREIVTLFRSEKQSAETKQISREFDLIEGPLATVRRETSNGELVFQPKLSSYQMCLISDDFAESFEQNLHSILFY